MLTGSTSIERFWGKTRENLHYMRAAHTKDFWLFESSVWFHMLANSMLAIYIPILMLQSGFSFSEIMLFFFFFHLINTPTNIIAGYMTSWIGARKTIILATGFQIAFFLFYGIIQPGDWTSLLILGALAAVYDALYYVASLYLFMQTTIDVNNSGKNTGILYAVIRSAGLIGPLIGTSLLLLSNGDSIYVIMAAIVAFIISVVPLFFTSLEQGTRAIGIPILQFMKEPYVLANHVSLGLHKIDQAVGSVLWPMFIYIYFGSLESVAVLALLIPVIALIFSFVSGYIKLTYRYHAIAIGAAGVALLWFGRLGFENGIWFYVSSVVIVLFAIPMQVPIESNIYRSGNESNALTASVMKNMFGMGIKAVLFGIFYLVSVTYTQSFVIALVALLLLTVFNTYRIYLHKKQKLLQ